MILGYARVSTRTQSLDDQIARLKAAGADQMFRDIGSGAERNRRGLKRALRELMPRDVLLVTRLDRLARSTRDLLNIVDEITAKGAGLRSLADPWADTTTPHGKLLLAVLGGLAEFERTLTLERTAAGRARAKANGVKLGRKFKLTPYQQDEARARRAKGEPVREIARSYNVHNSTIARLRPAGATA